jgi:hypothetical protein
LGCCADGREASLLVRVAVAVFGPCHKTTGCRFRLDAARTGVKTQVSEGEPRDGALARAAASDNMEELSHPELGVEAAHVPVLSESLPSPKQSGTLGVGRVTRCRSLLIRVPVVVFVPCRGSTGLRFRLVRCTQGSRRAPRKFHRACAMRSLHGSEATEAGR